MTILSVKNAFPGRVNVVPGIALISTDDVFETIITPGYLSNTSASLYGFSETDLAIISYSDGQGGFQCGTFRVAFIDGIIVLIKEATKGDITGPGLSYDNQVMLFSGTTGGVAKGADFQPNTSAIFGFDVLSKPTPVSIGDNLRLIDNSLTVPTLAESLVPPIELHTTQTTINGTVSINNISPFLFGTGTNFTSLKAGYNLIIQGHEVIIQSVNSDTSITLTEYWEFGSFVNVTATTDSNFIAGFKSNGSIGVNVYPDQNVYLNNISVNGLIYNNHLLVDVGEDSTIEISNSHNKMLIEFVGGDNCIVYLPPYQNFTRGFICRLWFNGYVSEGSLSIETTDGSSIYIYDNGLSRRNFRYQSSYADLAVLSNGWFAYSEHENLRPT